MERKRFISVSDGIARFGIDRSATWVIDLTKMRQSLRTNPTTSIFELEFGVRWVELNYIEKDGNKFICDDEDGDLWLVPSTEVEGGDEMVTQEQLIDDGLQEVCIDIVELSFYDRGNGCFMPIK